MVNSIVFSAGCHTGYNIVNGARDHVDGAARLGAGVRAEARHADLGHRLPVRRHRLPRARRAPLRRVRAPAPDHVPGGRRASRSRSGSALLAAKKRFLEETPGLTALDEKSLLQTTLFGLPMLSVNMPEGRIEEPPTEPIVEPATLSRSARARRQDLGLKVATRREPRRRRSTPQDEAADGPRRRRATWLEGPDGVAVRPTQPILPLADARRDAARPELTALRGVAFRGGTYIDTGGTTPLTAAPATELRGIHAPFFTDVFFPTQPWTTNYFDALGGGSTFLHLTPVQHRSESPTMTRRVFDDLDLDLFYSGNRQVVLPGHGPAAATPAALRAGGGRPVTAVTPALAAPPTITGVETSFDGTRADVPRAGRRRPVRGHPERLGDVDDPAGRSATRAPGSRSTSTQDARTTRRCGRASSSSRRRSPRPGRRPLRRAGRERRRAGHDRPQPRRVLPARLDPRRRRAARPRRSDRDGAHVHARRRPPGRRTATRSRSPAQLTSGGDPGGRASSSTSASAPTGCPATTDADGRATVVLQAALTPGPYTVTASFAGDARRTPSSDASAPIDDRRAGHDADDRRLAHAGADRPCTRSSSAPPRSTAAAPARRSSWSSPAPGPRTSATRTSSPGKTDPAGRVDVTDEFLAAAPGRQLPDRRLLQRRARCPAPVVVPPDSPSTGRRRRPRTSSSARRSGSRLDQAIALLQPLAALPGRARRQDGGRAHEGAGGAVEAQPHAARPT